jgi:hypothetical protein
MKCPLCRQRKGRRQCPARGEVICSHCCGTKRRREIACPADCLFLQGAHAGAWEGRTTERERDARRIAPHVAGFEEPQLQLFFFLLLGLRQIAARYPEADDRLFTDAVDTLVRNAETRLKGVIYEHPTGDARAQVLAQELAETYKTRDAEGHTVTLPDAELLPVLRALAASLHSTLAEQADPREFLEMTVRLTPEPPERDEDAPPRLVLP